MANDVSIKYLSIVINVSGDDDDFYYAYTIRQSEATFGINIGCNTDIQNGILDAKEGLIATTIRCFSEDTKVKYNGKFAIKFKDVREANDDKTGDLSPLLAAPQFEKMKAVAVDKFNPLVLDDFLRFLFRCRAGEKITTDDPKTMMSGRVRNVYVYFFADDSKKGGKDGGITAILDKKKAEEEDRKVSVQAKSVESSDSGMCNDIFVDVIGWVLIGGGAGGKKIQVPKMLTVKCAYNSDLKAKEMSSVDTPDSSVTDNDSDTTNEMKTPKSPKKPKLSEKASNAGDMAKDVKKGFDQGSQIGNDIMGISSAGANEIAKERAAIDQANKEFADKYASDTAKLGMAQHDNQALREEYANTALNAAENGAYDPNDPLKSPLQTYADVTNQGEMGYVDTSSPNAGDQLKAQNERLKEEIDKMNNLPKDPTGAAQMEIYQQKQLEQNIKDTAATSESPSPNSDPKTAGHFYKPQEELKEKWVNESNAAKNSKLDSGISSTGSSGSANSANGSSAGSNSSNSGAGGASGTGSGDKNSGSGTTGTENKGSSSGTNANKGNTTNANADKGGSGSGTTGTENKGSSSGTNANKGNTTNANADKGGSGSGTTGTENKGGTTNTNANKGNATNTNANKGSTTNTNANKGSTGANKGGTSSTGEKNSGSGTSANPSKGGAGAPKKYQNPEAANKYYELENKYGAFGLEDMESPEAKAAYKELMDFVDKYRAENNDAHPADTFHFPINRK